MKITRGRSTIPIIVAAMAAFLAGCQGNAMYGEGPITLSPHTSALYKSYLQEQYPLVFTVSTDGNESTYYWCSAFGCDLPKAKSIRVCEQRSNGVPCKVYAVRRQIVWKGTVDNQDYDSVDVEMELVGKDPEYAPKHHKGAVVYMPGYSPDDPIEETDGSIPGYLKRLHEMGWHAYKLYTVHEHRSVLTLDKQVEALRRLIQGLKQRGFKRVILTGQSAGGWLALYAAAYAPEVDGIVAATPSRYGSRVNNMGSGNQSFGQSTGATLRLLRKVRDTRVVLAFFDGDPWEPAERAGQVEALLARTGLRSIVLDHPEGIYGHHGAWSEAFRDLYTECLDRFFQGENMTEASCRAPGVALQEHDPGKIDRSLLADGTMRLSPAALKVFMEKYRPLPVIDKGTYSYKFFAYSRRVGGWGWSRAVGGKTPRKRAFEEALRRCELYDNKGGCRIYAIGNQVVGDDGG